MSFKFIDDSPWYQEGLRFKCTQCGQCCTGEPGYVWLSSADIERLSKHFNMSQEAFLKTYTRRVGKRISLLEDAKTYDCILLKNRRCSAYDARPIQCRRFPWWPSTIASKASWEDAKNFCEGIDHPEGKHFSKEEIADLSQSD